MRVFRVVKNRMGFNGVSNRLAAALRRRIWRTSPPSKRLHPLLLSIGLAACLNVSACTGASSDQPTPDAAKRFLKLRGYDFDVPSFFKAAANGDVMAVNGFMSAGINVNAKNSDDDTALTASAARGNAKVVEALLRGGADVNLKGRSGWTALPDASAFSASRPTLSARSQDWPLERAATYAKRFAAKEATSKALGTGLKKGVFWRDMGVANLPSGQPTMRLTGGAARRLAQLTPPGHSAHIHVSLTDDFPLAVAFVIISAELDPKEPGS